MPPAMRRRRTLRKLRLALAVLVGIGVVAVYVWGFTAGNATLVTAATAQLVLVVLLVVGASMGERGQGEVVLTGIDGNLYLARGSVCSASGRERCY